MANLNPLQIVEGPIFALLGKSALDVSPDTFPAWATASIASGGSWGGTWTNLGYFTEEGLSHAGMSPPTTPVNSSQQRGSVTTLKGMSAQKVTGSMLELTAQNLQYAMGQGTITTTGSYVELEMTDDPITYYALGLETYGPNGKLLRIIYPVVVPAVTGNVQQRIGQPAAVPVEFSRAAGKIGNPKWRFGL